MATTTALDRRVALQRIQSESDSSPSTADASPVDSPRQSPSSTSLSSLSSVDNAYGKLIDTYGNEFEVPDFTIKDIRDAIPKHCFERSALTGLTYVARDIALLATTFVIAYNLIPQVPSPAARFVLWAIYGFVQGLFGTGLWVIAHECGHGAFSASSRINNTVGWILHSALLVPFFSWQMSHSKHHKATGHMERDMVFLPRTREQHASKIGKMVHELGELAEETPAYTLMVLVGQQLFGWPQYLWTNVTGHNFHERQREGRGKGKTNGLGGGVNHFDPRSPLYDNVHAKLVLMSDLGLVIAFAALFLLARRFGLGNMLVWYGVPYLWVNHWLVAITYLQHTDGSLPHYSPEEWNFVRGAAATIDRDFGFIGRHLMHGIIETHVLHHYVSTIPFYHADEATRAIIPVMGRHYKQDVRGGALGFVKSLYTSARMCQWVEPNEGATGPAKGVLFFRNLNGLGAKPAGGRKSTRMVIGVDDEE